MTEKAVTALEDIQLASSVKYASAVRAFIGEIRPGLFALWHVDASLLLITEDWDEVLTAYRSRPLILPRKSLTTHGIDIEALEIKI